MKLNITLLFYNSSLCKEHACLFSRKTVPSFEGWSGNFIYILSFPQNVKILLNIDGISYFFSILIEFSFVANLSTNLAHRLIMSFLIIIEVGALKC